VYIYDGKTYDVVTHIDLASNLDELQYDARTRRLCVGCMSAEKTGIAVISIPDGKLLARLRYPTSHRALQIEHSRKPDICEHARPEASGSDGWRKESSSDHMAT
jgi:hypothetical protein